MLKNTERNFLVSLRDVLWVLFIFYLHFDLEIGVCGDRSVVYDDLSPAGFGVCFVGRVEISAVNRKLMTFAADDLDLGRDRGDHAAVKLAYSVVDYYCVVDDPRLALAMDMKSLHKVL